MTKLRRVGKLSDRMHPPTWAMMRGGGGVGGWGGMGCYFLCRMDVAKTDCTTQGKWLALTVSQNILAELTKTCILVIIL